jgi:hypothetical protein
MAIPYAAATPCPPQTLAASEYFGFDSSSPRAVVASAIVLQPDHSSIAATGGRRQAGDSVTRCGGCDMPAQSQCVCSRNRRSLSGLRMT